MARIRSDWPVLAILFVPSIYLLLTVPPLWRDSDGFNQIASTFAPKGIIHWLPVYCLGGRLVVILAGIANSLVLGHGLPPLSISITPLSDFGVYTLVVLQHLLLVFSLYHFLKNVVDNALGKVIGAAFFALTPWMYVYANCIGSEAFSNPLIVLAATLGWNCLRTGELRRSDVLIYLAVLVAASLTRQINILMVALLPLAFLPLAVGELWASRKGMPASNPFINGRRLLLSVGAALLVIGMTILIQVAMCWVCRVPFRSTLGQTFEWRLAYWRDLTEAKRSLIFERIDAKTGDPVIAEALTGLNQSLSQGDQWKDMFLFYRIDDILLRSGFKDMQVRTWQIDLRLNQVAVAVLCSFEPNYLRVVWSDFLRAPLYSQSDLAYSPFILTDWLRTQLAYPRYGRLRGLATFNHETGYYDVLWKQMPYLRLLGGLPMLWMAGGAILLNLIGIIRVRKGGFAWLRAGYSIALLALAILMIAGSCLTTFSAARFYLPSYSLFQMAMIFGGTAVAGWKSTERLETLPKSS